MSDMMFQGFTELLADLEGVAPESKFQNDPKTYSYDVLWLRARYYVAQSTKERPKGFGLCRKQHKNRVVLV